MKKQLMIYRKKTTVIVSILAACFVIGGIFAGLTLTTESNAKGTSDTVKASQELKDAEKKDTKEEKTDKKETAAEEKVKTKEPKKEEGKNNNTANNNNTGSTTNKPSANKPNSGSVEKPSKPTHTHNYVATEVTEYEERTIYGSRCNSCGYTTTTGIHDHMIANKFTCGSYTTGWEIGKEVVPVVYTYYICSCGDMHY